MKYKNIFLTGSTGILGKPLLKKLVNEGHSVFALSRNKLNNDFLISNNAKIINGDLFNDDIYEQLKEKSIEAIFHVAGENKKCQKDPSGMFKTNIEGTKQMLELGNKLNIEKFIYTSSAATLGEKKGSIGNEDSTHRGTFLSDYEESKYLAEEVAFAFNIISSLGIPQYSQKSPKCSVELSPTPIVPILLDLITLIFIFGKDA